MSSYFACSIPFDDAWCDCFSVSEYDGLGWQLRAWRDVSYYSCGFGQNLWASR